MESISFFVLSEEEAKAIRWEEPIGGRITGAVSSEIKLSVIMSPGMNGKINPKFQVISSSNTGSDKPMDFEYFPSAVFVHLSGMYCVPIEHYFNFGKMIAAAQETEQSSPKKEKKTKKTYHVFGVFKQINVNALDDLLGKTHPKVERNIVKMAMHDTYQYHVRATGKRQRILFESLMKTYNGTEVSSERNKE